MTKKPKTRIAELRDAIRRADDLYYNLGQPELTDSEYDALFRELRELEDQYPKLRTDDSPTARVGSVAWTSSVRTSRRRP